MLDAVSKSVFHALALSNVLKRLASRYGTATPRSFARRFIAGETIEEAIETCRKLQSQGMSITLDHLGESVNSVNEADSATRDYLHVIEQMSTASIDRNVSIKLTQLGLDVDRETCVDNVRRIMDAAGRLDFFVRVDMEDSAHVAATIDVFDLVWQHGHRNAGLVLQSALYRSERDLQHIIDIGARVRLVKGAYKEPKTVAYQRKADVDAAYVRMMRKMLLDGNYPAIATHDAAIIEETKRFAKEHSIGNDRFEFQMLFGIRRDLQAGIVAEGYRLRVYVPYGREWFPYFMRRLGERPANLGFVIRGILAERHA